MVNKKNLKNKIEQNNNGVKIFRIKKLEKTFVIVKNDRI